MTKCSVPDCGSAVLAKGLCSLHYTRLRRTGQLERGRPGRNKCTVDGCDRWTVSHGLCELHRSRERREKERAERLASREARACLACGEPLRPEQRADTLYCSRKCKERQYVRDGKAADASARWYFKATYGLSLDDVAALLDSQGGRCAICRTEDPAGRHGRFHVDHDHATNRVRGMLCDDCNLGLGKFRDDPELLLAAVAYLRA